MNDPSLCHFAAQGIDLPYAGFDSVCPACNSPLALLGHLVPADYEHEEIDTPSNMAISNSQALLKVSDHRKDLKGQFQPFFVPSKGVIQFSRLVALGSGLALLGIISARIFAPSPPVDNPATQESQNSHLNDSGLTARTDGLNLTQISPPAVRQLSQDAQAFVSPDPDSAVIVNLAKGVVLDMTGRLHVRGRDWARITLPHDRSRSGFVRETLLATLGDGEGDFSNIDPTAVNTIQAVNGPIMPVQIGPWMHNQSITYQIIGPPAALRLQPGYESVQIGQVQTGLMVSVIGQLTNATGTWFQISLTDGRTGWIAFASMAPIAMPTTSTSSGEPDTSHSAAGSQTIVSPPGQAVSQPATTPANLPSLAAPTDTNPEAGRP
ncbi:SH3 domain-containing protein [Candidatus Phycosocius spiralis]|uniref:SH3 domain-containing protein n=1 Tax=Candidatus Phycosocius spiralis TaxID=2815099 RepID=UPI0024E172BF|nr:SH3 domain-containing protein [Candidatus Phycosocius spiralis]